MHLSAEQTSVFHYVIEIEDREFLLVIMPDGMSHWDDHTQRRTIRHPSHQHLELRAFAGDEKAFRLLKKETSEFTISVAVPEKVFLKAVQMAEKQKREEAATGNPQATSQEIAKDVTEMDYLLTNFFWQEVNPLLCQPLNLPIQRHRN
jgi:succinate dehydrogenase flavin-adding protein (antitoxin of CptAB toxin-antitoxin module)